MKLAEALIERADLQKRIAQLEGRLLANARVQEGESPAEDPNELLQELDRSLCQLENLIVRINHTNDNVTDNGQTLTVLLAQRDCLTLRLKVLRSFLQNASAVVSRSSLSEIKIKSTVPVAQLQKQLDAFSCQRRELDTRIQGLNWTTELL